ncbi:hypothetical protein [Xanthobacter sediminis]
MSATTYPAKSFSPTGGVPAETPAKGILWRMLDALIAARAAQAEREVARYLALRGEDIRDFGR